MTCSRNTKGPSQGVTYAGDPLNAVLEGDAITQIGVTTSHKRLRKRYWPSFLSYCRRNRFVTIMRLMCVAIREQRICDKAYDREDED
jgi:hypothetical protein